METRRRNTLVLVLALVIALAGALVCRCKDTRPVASSEPGASGSAASGAGTSDPAPSQSPPSTPSSAESGSAQGDMAGSDEPLPIDPMKDMPEQSLSTDATMSAGQRATALVDGRSDIYSASLAAADPDRHGVLPAKVTLGASTGVIVFPRIVGKSGCAREALFPADGGNCVGGDTAIEAAGGISGIVAHDRSLFLVGVFLAGPPPAVAPPSLDFTANIRFRELAPVLGQVFFIGDGRSDDGAEQRFTVPAGATHLYLGFADADSFQGRPGEYGDNSGGLRVTLAQQ